MGVTRAHPSTRFLIGLIGAVTVVAGIASFAWLAWADRTATLTEAEKSLSEVARLMEEHTQAVLQINAIQLQRIEDLIGARPLSDLKGSVGDWRELNRILAKSPMGHSVWIFDSRAELALSSVKPDGMILNVADRDYFAASKDGGEQFTVSPLITGRLTGGLLFPMAMRLAEADGGFKGVAALSIRADYFLDFYQALRPDASSIFGLYRDDGEAILRWPLPDTPVSREAVLRSPPFSAHRDRTAGTYRSASVIDGVDRMVAYRRLADFPLLVATGMPVDAVLADWRLRTLRNGAFTLVGLAAILALASLAQRSADAEARALVRYEAEAKSLAAALDDKDVLFQEIHHRVKNNLQIISSMLMMQSLRVADDNTREALQQSLDRIHSMGLVHQTLYQTNQAAQVDIGPYLGGLIGSLEATYAADERAIALRLDLDHCTLGLEQAVPLGLLANEALTNALKHAFPDGQGGTITVSLHQAEGLVRFRVQDSGVGLAAGSADGVGMTLIHALARQLDGELTVDGADGGTRLALSFPAR